MDNCVFCKIVRGEIPSRNLYEDDEVFAFHDIHPAAPVHFMLVPKQHIESLLTVEEAQRDVLGKIMVLAPRLAKQQGLESGFRIIINSGRAGGQEVFHLHVHVIGNPKGLPPMIARS